MWKSQTRACLVAALVLVCVGPESARGQDTAAGEDSAGDAAGTWRLNRALSDDPGEQLQNVRGAARAPGRRPPGGASGGARANGASLDAVRHAVEGFSIALTDSTVVITYPDRSLDLITDGRKRKIRVSEERELEFRAWREGTHLVIERRLDGGVTLSEEYSVQAGTGRLHVLTRLAGDRLPRPISFMRVYDPADSVSEG